MRSATYRPFTWYDHVYIQKEEAKTYHSKQYPRDPVEGYRSSRV
jgi:hypothetical protein